MCESDAREGAALGESGEMLGRGRREASYADSRRPGFVDLPLAGKRETREIVYRRRQARVFVGPKFDVRRRLRRRCCRCRRRCCRCRRR